MYQVLLNEQSVRAYGMIASSTPRYLKVSRNRTITFCVDSESKTCLAADESVTVHADCFCLFGKTCSAKDKYRRLWVAGTRMYAWRGAPALMLEPVICAPTEIISSAAGFHGMLLPELAGMVGGHLQVEHPLLRFCKVLQLAKYLSSSEFDNAAVYPLCEVLSWSRGTSPVLVEQGQAADPILRLTIDSRGIKSIDRVSDNSQESNSIGLSLPSHAYIVGSVEQLSEIDMEFWVSLSSTLFTRGLTRPPHPARNEPPADSGISKRQYLEHPVATYSCIPCI